MIFNITLMVSMYSVHADHQGNVEDHDDGGVQTTNVHIGHQGGAEVQTGVPS